MSLFKTKNRDGDRIVAAVRRAAQEGRPIVTAVLSLAPDKQGIDHVLSDCLIDCEGAGFYLDQMTGTAMGEYSAVVLVLRRMDPAADTDVDPRRR